MNNSQNEIFREQNIDVDITPELNLLLVAKKSFIVNILASGLLLLSLFFFYSVQKSMLNVIKKRLEKRDVLVITDSGAFLTNTIVNVKQILRQFGILAFKTTLSYDTTNPLVQMDFMRVYAIPDIFIQYKKMITSSQKSIIESFIDTTKPIEISQIKNNLYKIVIYGIQYNINSLNSSNYNIKLTLLVKKTNNVNPENYFNFLIVSYQLEKI